MKTSKIYILTALLFVYSCSSVKDQKDKVDLWIDRIPASESKSCSTLIEAFFETSSGKVSIKGSLDIKADDVTNIMLKKGILKRKENFLLLEHPSIDWINKVRKSFITNLKSWNKNRYPVFYFGKEIDFEKRGRSIASLLEKKIAGTANEEEKVLLDQILNEVKSFSTYQNEIDAIIKERISLQYNIDMLKKIKLDKEAVDVKVTLAKASGDVTEIITLRKEDKNKGLAIHKLKQQLKELNGKIFRHGKVEERVIRQAMLKDIVTIYHREIEHAIKNNINRTAELDNLYSSLSAFLKNSDFEPSSYGVFRVDRKVLQDELMMFTKLDRASIKISVATDKVKASFGSFFRNRNAGTDEEKVGFFKNMYLSVSNMTVGDMTKYGIVAGVGFGTSHYFFLGIDNKNEDNGDGPSVEEITVEDLKSETEENGPQVINNPETHEERISNTEAKNESYLKIQYKNIEMFISNLFN